MKKDGVILIAEQDQDHFDMMKQSLLRSGVSNKIVNLADGRRTLDFLSDMTERPEGEHASRQYILFLDINLPDIGGMEVLEKIKADEKLSNVLVIMLTSTDDPQTIDRCYDLGCSMYIVKSAEKENFAESIKKIGHFLSVVEIASIK